VISACYCGQTGQYIDHYFKLEGIFLDMTQMPQGLRYLPKILVALTWSLAGFYFLSTTVLTLLIPHLAIQPDGFAERLLILSSSGSMILGGMLTGMISLLLWQPPFNRLVSLILAILIPTLLFFGSFVSMMGDTQGVRRHVIEATESRSIKNTRDQLLIQSSTLSLSKQLIQLGANVNARDPEGHSALYSASWEGRDPEILKLLLRSGAKPDALALRNAISWGRLDAIQLMLKATSDDGKAMIGELGNDALQANNVHTRTSEADRAEITKLLTARGAKQSKN
jgi:uncharacterized protein